MQISRHNGNRTQIDAVSPFTLLVAFSNLPGFGSGLDRCRVNGRRKRIENDRATNETAFV